MHLVSNWNSPNHATTLCIFISSTNTWLQFQIITLILQRKYKKVAAQVLYAVAKHSPHLAQSVVDCGALEALVICLEEFDPEVKEAAARALDAVSRHNAGVFCVSSSDRSFSCVLILTALWLCYFKYPYIISVYISYKYYKYLMNTSSFPKKEEFKICGV